MSSLPPPPSRAAEPIVRPSATPKSALVPPSVLLKRRTAILTGAAAAITIAGTLFGATIKGEQQTFSKKALRRRAEVDAAAQLELLESATARLLMEKKSLEDKIAGVHERRKRNAEREKEREKMAQMRRDLLGK